MVSWSVVGSAMVVVVCSVFLLWASVVNLIRLIIFSEILTVCEGLDVARLLGEPG